MNGKGWEGFGNWDYWKIVLHVVTCDTTDTDAELVVIIQTKQGQNRIEVRKHMTWNLNVQKILLWRFQHSLTEMRQKTIVKVFLFQCSRLLPVWTWIDILARILYLFLKGLVSNRPWEYAVTSTSDKLSLFSVSNQILNLVLKRKVSACQNEDCNKW